MRPELEQPDRYEPLVVVAPVLRTLQPVLDEPEAGENQEREGEGHGGDQIQPRPAGEADGAADPDVGGAGHAPDVATGTDDRARAEKADAGHDPYDHPERVGARVGEKIGRASRRERVCPYV